MRFNNLFLLLILIISVLAVSGYAFGLATDDFPGSDSGDWASMTCDSSPEVACQYWKNEECTNTTFDCFNGAVPNCVEGHQRCDKPKECSGDFDCAGMLGSCLSNAFCNGNGLCQCNPVVDSSSNSDGGTVTITNGGGSDGSGDGDGSDSGEATNPGTGEGDNSETPEIPETPQTPKQPIIPNAPCTDNASEWCYGQGNVYRTTEDFNSMITDDAIPYETQANSGANFESTGHVTGNIIDVPLEPVEVNYYPNHIKDYDVGLKLGYSKETGVSYLEDALFIAKAFNYDPVDIRESYLMSEFPAKNIKYSKPCIGCQFRRFFVQQITEDYRYVPVMNYGHENIQYVKFTNVHSTKTTGNYSDPFNNSLKVYDPEFTIYTPKEEFNTLTRFNNDVLKDNYDFQISSFLTLQGSGAYQGQNLKLRIEQITNDNDILTEEVGFQEKPISLLLNLYDEQNNLIFTKEHSYGLLTFRDENNNLISSQALNLVSIKQEFSGVGAADVFGPSINVNNHQILKASFYLFDVGEKMSSSLSLSEIEQYFKEKDTFYSHRSVAAVYNNLCGDNNDFINAYLETDEGLELLGTAVCSVGKVIYFSGSRIDDKILPVGKTIVLRFTGARLSNSKSELKASFKQVNFEDDVYLIESRLSEPYKISLNDDSQNNVVYPKASELSSESNNLDSPELAHKIRTYDLYGSFNKISLQFRGNSQELARPYYYLRANTETSEFGAQTEFDENNRLSEDFYIGLNLKNEPENLFFSLVKDNTGDNQFKIDGFFNGRQSIPNNNELFYGRPSYFYQSTKLSSINDYQTASIDGEETNDFTSGLTSSYVVLPYDSSKSIAFAKAQVVDDRDVLKLKKSSLTPQTTINFNYVDAVLEQDLVEENTKPVCYSPLPDGSNQFDPYPNQAADIFNQLKAPRNLAAGAYKLMYKVYCYNDDESFVKGSQPSSTKNINRAVEKLKTNVPCEGECDTSQEKKDLINYLIKNERAVYLPVNNDIRGSNPTGCIGQVSTYQEVSSNGFGSCLNKPKVYPMGYPLVCDFSVPGKTESSFGIHGNTMSARLCRLTISSEPLDRTQDTSPRVDEGYGTTPSNTNYPIGKGKLCDGNVVGCDAVTYEGKDYYCRDGSWRLLPYRVCEDETTKELGKLITCGSRTWECKEHDSGIWWTELLTEVTE